MPHPQHTITALKRDFMKTRTIGILCASLCLVFSDMQASDTCYAYQDEASAQVMLKEEAHVFMEQIKKKLGAALAGSSTAIYAETIEKEVIEKLLTNYCTTWEMKTYFRAQNDGTFKKQKLITLIRRNECIFLKFAYELFVCAIDEEADHSTGPEGEYYTTFMKRLLMYVYEIVKENETLTPPAGEYFFLTHPNSAEKIKEHTETLLKLFYAIYELLSKKVNPDTRHHFLQPKDATTSDAIIAQLVADTPRLDIFTYYVGSVDVIETV